MTIENRITIIKAMLQDQELLCGGIFQKEEYYAKKYQCSISEISDIWCFLQYAVSGDTLIYENGWKVTIRNK